MDSQNLDKYFEGIINNFKLKRHSPETEIDETVTSNLKDLDFEKKMKNILMDNLLVSLFQLEDLDINKEFELFIMEIYNRKTKELIKKETFKKTQNYFYLQIDKEYFFIPSKNLSYLYYNDLNTKTTKKILGLEETQQSDDTAKFFLENKKVNEIIETNEEHFFSDIKFNLISSKTISVIGENNNIPSQIFDNYYVKAKLLSKGNNPNVIFLDKNKEYKPGSGKIHYPLEKYYIKLKSQKGQIDASFISKKEFELKLLDCEIIYSNFENIK